MKHAMPIWILPLALLLVSGCVDAGNQAGVTQTAKAESFFGLGAHEHLVAGTAVRVRLAEPVSSETAKPGDVWHGVVQAPVVVDGDEIVGPGTAVEGIVTGVVPARHGNRAMVEIEMRKVSTDDRETTLRATTEPVIAGSPRARNLGALAGAEGADAEHEISAGSGREASVASANDADAADSRDLEVILPEGTIMTFTVSREVAMR